MQQFTYLALRAGVSSKKIKGALDMGQRAVLSRNTAKAIKALRYELGFTQTQLAGAAGVSVSTVKTWEAAKAMPSPKHYKALKDFLWSDECEADNVQTGAMCERLEYAKEQDLKNTELMKIYPGEQTMKGDTE